MFTITAARLTDEQVKEFELDCGAIDYATILEAERLKQSGFDGCSLPAVFSVAFKPAEDIVIPLNLCDVHFSALKISLHQGVAVDEDVFGAF